MNSEEHITLSLTFKDTASAIEFYSKAFGASELFRMALPDGGIAHAEMMFGGTKVMMSDEDSEYHAFAMPEGSTASCVFSISTENVDERYEAALAAGAEGLLAPKDMFYGMRVAVVKDPFGYRWSFDKRIE